MFELAKSHAPVGLPLNEEEKAPFKGIQNA
jgi:hypothetical protein